MNSKNMKSPKGLPAEVQRRLDETRTLELIFAPVEWISFKFLAATSVFLTYPMLSGWTNTLPAPWDMVATIIGVVMFYFVIDAGLAEMLRFWLGSRRSVTAKKNRAGRFLINVLFLILLTRIAVTTTFSLWASPEISTQLTGTGTESEYADRMERTAAAAGEKQQQATATLTELERSEATRVAAAEKKGQAIIEKAVRGGNADQQDSYRTQGHSYIELKGEKYSRTNNPYSDRIKAAERQAAALVRAERDRTKQARNLALNLSQDTSSTSTLSAIAQLGMRESNRYEATLARRTKLVWVLDLIAVLMGITACVIRVKRREYAGMPPPERSVSKILATARRRWGDSLLNGLESWLGIDIDGDGHIGTPPEHPTPELSEPAPIVQTGIPPETVADLLRIATGQSNRKHIPIQGFTNRRNKPEQPSGQPKEQLPRSPGTTIVPPTRNRAEQRNGTVKRNSPEQVDTKPEQRSGTARNSETEQPGTTDEWTIVNRNEPEQTEPDKPTIIQPIREVVIVDSNERNLRRKINQAWKRMHEQEDPTTPKENYRKVRAQLEAIGYTIEEPNGPYPLKLKITKPS